MSRTNPSSEYPGGPDERQDERNRQQRGRISPQVRTAEQRPTPDPQSGQWSDYRESSPIENPRVLTNYQNDGPPLGFSPQHRRPYGRPDLNIVQLQLQNHEIGAQRQIAYGGAVTPDRPHTLIGAAGTTPTELGYVMGFLQVTPLGEGQQASSSPTNLLNRYTTPPNLPTVQLQQVYSPDVLSPQTPPGIPFGNPIRTPNSQACPPVQIAPIILPQPLIVIPQQLATAPLGPDLPATPIAQWSPTVRHSFATPLADPRDQQSSSYQTNYWTRGASNQPSTSASGATNAEAYPGGLRSRPQETSAIMEERSRNVRARRNENEASPDFGITRLRLSEVRQGTVTLPEVHNTLYNQSTPNILRSVDERFFIRHLAPDEGESPAHSPTISRRHRETQHIIQQHLQLQGRSIRLSVEEALHIFRGAIDASLADARAARSLHPINNITQIRELAEQAYNMDIAQAIPPQPFSLGRDYKSHCYRCRGGVNQINAFFLKCGHVYCMACVLEKHFTNPKIVCDCGVTHGVSFALLALHGLYEEGEVVEPAVITWQYTDEHLMYYTWRRLQYYNPEQCRQNGFNMYFSTI